MKTLNGQIFLLIVFIGIVLIIYSFLSPTGRAISEFQGPDYIVPITYANLEQEASKNPAIVSLPNDALILLRFYNFNTGEREWEKNFIIKKESVKEVKEVIQADAVVWIKSNYLNGLTNENFCDVIKTANKNGDLGFESNLSKISLTWKYKNLMKYSRCT